MLIAKIPNVCNISMENKNAFISGPSASTDLPDRSSECRREHMSYVNAVLRLGTRQMAHLSNRPRSFGHPTADMPQNNGIIQIWLIRSEVSLTALIHSYAIFGLKGSFTFNTCDPPTKKRVTAWILERDFCLRIHPRFAFVRSVSTHFPYLSPFLV